MFFQSPFYCKGLDKRNTDFFILNRYQLDTPGPSHYFENIIQPPYAGYSFGYEGKPEKNPLYLKNQRRPLSSRKYGPVRNTDIGELVNKAEKTKNAEHLDYYITNRNLEKTIYPRTVNYHFGNDEKLRFYDYEYPAPNTYHVKHNDDFGGRSRKNKFSVPKAKRKTFVDRKGIKDSRDYDIDRYKEIVKGPTIRGKPKEMKDNGYPGPGAYHIPCSISYAPEYVRVERPYAVI